MKEVKKSNAAQMQKQMLALVTRVEEANPAPTTSREKRKAK